MLSDLVAGRDRRRRRHGPAAHDRRGRRRSPTCSSAPAPRPSPGCSAGPRSLLDQHPDQRADLVADPDAHPQRGRGAAALRGAVAGAGPLDSPREVELHGVTIPAGLEGAAAHRLGRARRAQVPRRRPLRRAPRASTTTCRSATASTSASAPRWPASRGGSPSRRSLRPPARVDRRPRRRRPPAHQHGARLGQRAGDGVSARRRRPPRPARPRRRLRGGGRPARRPRVPRPVHARRHARHVRARRPPAQRPPRPRRAVGHPAGAGPLRAHAPPRVDPPCRGRGRRRPRRRRGHGRRLLRGPPPPPVRPCGRRHRPPRPTRCCSSATSTTTRAAGPDG